MRRFIRDVLQAHASSLPHAEVEFRVPVPYQYFDSIHDCYAHGKTSTLTESQLRYADLTDLRCVDGEWQRKRKVAAVRVRGAVPYKLCISVESPAAPTKLRVAWINCTKRRWSYLFGDWRVDFTRSARACNIEIEYVHGIAELVALVASGPDSLVQLDTLMADLAPFCTVLAFGLRREESMYDNPGVPFPCIYTFRQPIPTPARAHYRRLMSQMQPVSLYEALPTDMDPVVSLKYDGVRMVLCAIRHEASGLDMVCGLTRKTKTHCIPCAGVEQEMVLDCEFMESERRFVVFDVFEIDQQPVKYKPYVWRLNRLRQLCLPKLLGGYEICIKAFYPAAAVTAKWYNEQDQSRIDGLIIHNKNDVLGNKAVMFKWKPQHTVDMVANSRGVLVDSDHGKPFMRMKPDHGMPLQHGQIWECTMDETTKFIIPMRQRHDKNYGNPLHVLTDVKRAHAAAYSIADVGRMLKRQLRERVARKAEQERKRKRCITAV